MLRSITLAGIVGALIASACALAERGEKRDPSPVAEEPNREAKLDGDSREQVAAEASGLATGTVSRLLYLSDDLVQSASFEFGEKNLVFHSLERQPGDVAPELSSSTEFGTSYDIEYVVHGGQANLFYVIGRGRGAAYVVERWNVQQPTGAIIAERPFAASLVGTPVTTPPVTRGISGGGSWVHPDSRTGSVTADRTEIYRGSDFVALAAAAADPDGRFVVVLAVSGPGTRQLFRLDATDSVSPPVEILDPAGFSAIDRSEQVFVREYVGNVRALVIEAPGPPDVRIAVMFDSENDGLFSAPLDLSVPQWKASGFDDSSNWVSDFLTFP